LEQFVLPTEPIDHFREQSALYHDEGIRSSFFFPEDLDRGFYSECNSETIRLILPGR
jgi:hypothetical protein